LAGGGRFNLQIFVVDTPQKMADSARLRPLCLKDLGIG